MTIDALRRGWPEPILAGHYSFRTDPADGATDLLLLAPINAVLHTGFRSKKLLQVHVDGRPVMSVFNGNHWPHLPPGPKLWTVGPDPQPLLLLRQHPFAAAPWTRA